MICGEQVTLGGKAQRTTLSDAGGATGDYGDAAQHPLVPERQTAPSSIHAHL
jgi:hypothetical protein